MPSIQPASSLRQMMSETIARSSSVITSFSMIEATMMISSKVRSSLAVSSIVFDLKLSR